MKIISEININSFRSIEDASLKHIGDFNALAGLNNSGKSNVLRALNAFFTGQTDGNSSLEVDEDYYRPNLRKKKAKRIRIAVKFTLPPAFKFRKGIEAVQEFLGSNEFIIAKEWDRSSSLPSYFLDDKPVSVGDRNKVDQFLSLISFRYIPNRVLPIDVIRREHQSLRDVLVRRLSRRGKEDEEVFLALSRKSADLIQHLSSRVHGACPEVAEVRLATPTSWRDMVFAFGYKLVNKGVEIDDVAQGSGIQSLLMLETLSLIDRDYFQQFGWKQASIWAVEEPESSLHSSLEARVASFLSEISTNQSSRLQIVATTHSDLMLQYCDKAVFVDKLDQATVFTEANDKREVLERAAKIGISRWIHPILASPLEPVILVEGKSDHVFLSQAIRICAPKLRVNVQYLEQLQGGAVTGGVDEMLKYIKANLNALRTRVSTAPVIIVLDWDSASKKAEFEKHLKQTDPCIVLVWPETTFNPNLGKAFRGIERHLSDRILDQADDADLLGTTTAGTRTVGKDDLRTLKTKILDVMELGIVLDDLQYARPFIDELVRQIG
jgi:predicted ATP-dependent endonuclease of OLD family